MEEAAVATFRSAGTTYLRQRALYYRALAVEAPEPEQATYCRELADAFDREAAVRDDAGLEGRAEK
jgi:hypothetical protein